MQLETHIVNSVDHLPEPERLRGYPGCDIAEALDLYRARYGFTPRVMWIVADKRGKTVFFEVPDEEATANENQEAKISV